MYWQLVAGLLWNSVPLWINCWNFGSLLSQVLFFKEGRKKEVLRFFKLAQTPSGVERRGGESHNLSMVGQLGQGARLSEKAIYNRGHHNIVSVTFVRGLWETDKRASSIAHFKPLQVDSMPSSVLPPDSYPPLPCYRQTCHCSREPKQSWRKWETSTWKRQLTAQRPERHGEERQWGSGEDVWRYKQQSEGRYKGDDCVWFKAVERTGDFKNTSHFLM